jgi:predicted TIM-barrel fold metal-dependent hydrolase
MSYAQGRTCYDSDSHLMETADWLHSHATPDEAALIPEFSPGNAGVGVRKAIAKAEARRADAGATEKLLEQPIISGPKGWFAYGASTPDERSKALDLLGFQRQLVFPTFALGQFARSHDDAVLYAGANALNRGMAHFCANDPRLLSVGFLPLRDPARAQAVLEAGIALGVKAFWVSADPAGDRSPAHVAHEPIWERLASANIPIMLHIGAGKLMPAAYHNNGRPAPNDWLGGGENLRAKDWPATAHAAQNFLTTLVLDGVFERHERLRCGVIELGATWMPGFMQILDQAGANFKKSEPLLGELKLKPSEYLRRQVRVSLFAFEDAGWLIETGGEELFMFASDYPHPEGGRDPLGRFEAALDARKIGDAARARFYHQNFAFLMGLD